MTPKRNPVGWFEIYVNDMIRAKTFYETMLNIQMQPLPNPEAMDSTFEMQLFPSDMENLAPGCGGTLCRMEGFTPAQAARSFTFPAKTAALRHRASQPQAGRCFVKNFPSLLTASSLSSSIPRAT